MRPPPETSPRPPDLRALVAPYEAELVAFRRDLHTHPEIAHHEVRTTARVADRLRVAGLEPQLLPGTGLICDVGPDRGPVVGLRADLDALPLREETGLEYASVVDGVSHACGHDVHTAALVGAGLVLADLHRAGRLPGRVRLVFQPAEEVSQPSGALHVIASGGLDGLERIYALHCDPGTDVGTVGARAGSITSAADQVVVRLHGSGGHTSRPHLTEDLTFALASIAVNVPAVLSRRIDVRSSVSVVWGQIHAGSAPNAIPAHGFLSGTLRCLDGEAWQSAGDLFDHAVRQAAAPFGVEVQLEHIRGVPPVINSEAETGLLEAAARAELGPDAVVLTPQSMGGEDFAWMTQEVPGAMMRLGTRTPRGETFDLHRGDYIPDEHAIGCGVRVMAAAALRAVLGLRH